MTRTGIERAIATLTSAPAAQVTERYFINPKRGPLLVAGAVIVDGLMRRYRVDAVRVSEASIREGDPGGRPRGVRGEIGCRCCPQAGPDGLAPVDDAPRAQSPATTRPRARR